MYINQWQYWSIIIALIQVKYLFTSFRQPNYRAIDLVNRMKSSDHTNNDKANYKYKSISFIVFTLPNARNLWINTLSVFICEITKHILISVIDHNV